MFRRYDIPPLLLLLVLIVLVMITLSQILIVQSGSYNKVARRTRHLQRELRDMDTSLRALMARKVPSIELNRRLLQNDINAVKFARILQEASRVANRTSHPDVSPSSPVRPSPPPLSANDTGDSRLHHNDNATNDADNRTFIDDAEQMAVTTSRLADSATNSKRTVPYCPPVPPGLGKFSRSLLPVTYDRREGMTR